MATRACAPFEHIEAFNKRRERHRRVDIAFRNLGSKAFRYQYRTDHQEKSQSQHENGGVRIDEVGEGRGRDQHGQDRNNNGDNHDGHVFSHADSCDDAVDGKHDAQQYELPHRCCKSERYVLALEKVWSWIGITPIAQQGRQVVFSFEFSQSCRRPM